MCLLFPILLLETIQFSRCDSPSNRFLRSVQQSAPRRSFGLHSVVDCVRFSVDSFQSLWSFIFILQKNNNKSIKWNSGAPIRSPSVFNFVRIGEKGFTHSSLLIDNTHIHPFTHFLISVVAKNERRKETKKKTFLLDFRSICIPNKYTQKINVLRRTSEWNEHTQLIFFLAAQFSSVSFFCGLLLMVQLLYSFFFCSVFLSTTALVMSSRETK